MSSVRAPAVAGLFYPREPEILRAVVRDCLDGARLAGGDRPPKALIVPHAGYRYSGAVAGSAYRRLEPRRGQVKRVVLFGPAHRVPLAGLAVPSARAFETPMGRVDVDRDAVLGLMDLPAVCRSDEAHAQEHSLEVQLPFLIEVLGGFLLVPVVVGRAAADAVAEALDRLWGGPETLVVLSTDLSHFHSQAVARRLDAETVAAIERLDGDALGAERACGWAALRGLLAVAWRRGLACRALDVRTSADTAGGPDSVVGYGAFELTEG